ncbi:MAG: hypothetical protein ABJL99_22870 [Aliishimia sp.]
MIGGDPFAAMQGEVVPVRPRWVRLRQHMLVAACAVAAVAVLSVVIRSYFIGLAAVIGAWCMFWIAVPLRQVLGFLGVMSTAFPSSSTRVKQLFVWLEFDVNRAGRY